MIENFLSALALVFIFEGLFPLFFPERFRKTMEKILKLEDRYLRLISLFSMLFGLLLLYIIHSHSNPS